MALEPAVSPAASALNRLWRIIATGFCFSLFGLGGLLLSLVWFNLLLVFVRNPIRRRRTARRSISLSFRVFLRIATLLGVLDYRFHGLNRLRQDEGCLVVANHPSLLDYVLIASVMPETDCMVKSALLNNPFVSGVIRSADYLLNDEAGNLLPHSRERLSRGDCILIFPEGTRTRPGEPMKLQRGAANIAVRCSSDVRIVALRCSERMLDKQSKWYDVPAIKPVFTVNVGEKIAIDRFLNAEQQEPAIAARRLNRHLLYKLQANPE